MATRSAEDDGADVVDVTIQRETHEWKIVEVG
jgi:hypothetical protein